MFFFSIDFESNLDGTYRSRVNNVHGSWVPGILYNLGLQILRAV